jgi:uncharacterized protein YbjT (DUF2867 family)
MVGGRICAHVRSRGARTIQLSRTVGVDLLSGDNLGDALAGVDVVIDASRPAPGTGADLVDALTTASANLVRACVKAPVKRLMFVSIVGVQNPSLAEVDYYAAKRAQEQVIEKGTVPFTIIRSTQWYEFATSSFAVEVRPGDVRVQDWLIQPVAADSVAHMISDLVFSPSRPSIVSIAGPDVMRLPMLTERVLRHRRDMRQVSVLPPSVAGLGAGALLPPGDAVILGPDVDSWLRGAS